MLQYVRNTRSGASDLIGLDATLEKTKHNPDSSLQGRFDTPEFDFFCGTRSSSLPRNLLDRIVYFDECRERARPDIPRQNCFVNQSQPQSNFKIIFSTFLTKTRTFSLAI